MIGPDGSAREGVLFVTDDEITAPLPAPSDPHQHKAYKDFGVYTLTVDALREGVDGKGPAAMAATYDPSSPRSAIVDGLTLRPVDTLDLSRTVAFQSISGSGTAAALRQLRVLIERDEWS